jgi:hypothetical protein
MRGRSKNSVHNGLVADHPIVTDIPGNTVVHFDRAGRHGIGQVRDRRQVGIVDLQ